MRRMPSARRLPPAAVIDQGRVQQDGQLWSQRFEQLHVLLLDAAGPCARAMHLAQDLGQGDQVVVGKGVGGPLTLGAVGQRSHPVHDAHGDLLAADGAAVPMRNRLELRLPADIAGAVTVQVVFAFWREEFHGTAELSRVAAAQGGEDRVCRLDRR